MRKNLFCGYLIKAELCRETRLLRNARNVSAKTTILVLKQLISLFFSKSSFKCYKIYMQITREEIGFFPL